ncbi:MAG: GGDEF domain-containing protein, partial [Candidatus Methylomirabilis sp.]|nr:GGDEF domain-containing protein [Deltaproteobacteria bacterium]
VIADIDHFKSVNDTYGHDAGDKALVYVAHALAGALRPYDVVGRYVGEEFMLVLSGARGPALHQAADRVRKAVADGAADLGDKQLKVTVSMGAAAFLPSASAATAIDAVVKAADEALYVSKRSGRNRVTVAGDGPALPNPAETRAEGKDA